MLPRAMRGRAPSLQPLQLASQHLTFMRVVCIAVPGCRHATSSADPAARGIISDVKASQEPSRYTGWIMQSSPDVAGLQSAICKNGLRITSPLSGCSQYTRRLLGRLYNQCKA